MMHFLTRKRKKERKKERYRGVTDFFTSSHPLVFSSSSSFVFVFVFVFFFPFYGLSFFFAFYVEKRIGREQFLRNVATALGNSGDERAIEALEKAIEKETSSLIKEHCQWAIRRIMNVNQKDQDINNKTINNVK